MKLRRVCSQIGCTLGGLATGVRAPVLAVALMAIAALGAGPLAAQSGDAGAEGTVGSPAAELTELEALKAEIEALKAGQNAIRRDLASIVRLLQQRPQAQAQARAQPPAFEPQQVSIAGAGVMGDASAQVTLIEFTDYQCPFCRRHFTGTKPQILKNYVESGQLKYVQKEFPIQSIHPQAFKAAEAALCAGDQDKYWEMVASNFANSRQLQPEHLMTNAEGLGLDMEAFGACLEGETYAKQVRDDLKLGSDAGIRGTPSFLVGLTDPEDPDKVMVTHMLRGAQGYNVFQQAIDQLIAEAEKGSS